MALKINHAQIGERKEIPANATKTFRWNNPPSNVIAYNVLPDQAAGSGQHGTSTGEVGIVAIHFGLVKDNYNGNKDWVDIEVKNYRATAGAYTVWQTWVTS